MYPSPVFLPLQVAPDLTVYVAQDYLKDEMGLRVTLVPGEAQDVADFYDAFLPTPRIVCLIEDVAALIPFKSFSPREGESRDSKRIVAASNAACDLAIGTINPSTIYAGHKKDIVVGRTRLTHPNKVSIFGALSSKKARRQPLFPPENSSSKIGHSLSYKDYSHGTRLIRRKGLWRGKEVDLVREMGKHRELTQLLAGVDGVLVEAALRY